MAELSAGCSVCGTHPARFAAGLCTALAGAEIYHSWTETVYEFDSKTVLYGRSKWENCMVNVPRPWVADRNTVE